MLHSLPENTWHKSPYSSDTDGNCVACRKLPHGETVAVHDTKDPTRGTLHIPAPAWNAFLSAVTAQPA
ncbi:DUF397 domain-containing protein [Streptomyces iconiensis]|uniref:DUF397 domain-containing protein n=1 Tax=Streptomyces iconiensis TaxID=1384038 RepID=A0ABT6ZXP6_9ACTN|nr:DUF397 domain-containing protein [Streptomyces iconiensis]MDJ1133840.1 DUF397 domain-containing protein [Streptomyces iconiensis]